MPLELPGYELLIDGVYGQEYTIPARGSIIRLKRIVLLSKYDAPTSEMIAEYLQDAALEASIKKITDESSLEWKILLSHPHTRAVLRNGGQPAVDMITPLFLKIKTDDSPYFIGIRYGIVSAQDLETAQQQGMIVDAEWYHDLFSSDENDWLTWQFNIPSNTFTEEVGKMKKKLRKNSAQLQKLGDNPQHSLDLVDQFNAVVTAQGVSQLYDQTLISLDHTARYILAVRLGQAESEISTAQKEQINLQRAFTGSNDGNHGKGLYRPKPS